MKTKSNSIKPKEIDSHGDLFTDECIENMLKSPMRMNISLNEIKGLNAEIMSHSIGFRYKKIRLAINDPDKVDEFKLWNEYLNKIDNIEIAERGYFWVVDDAEIIV